MYRWLDERLHLGRFHRKYLRKAFEVHHAYFLGEITLFALVTLVLTGIFLALNYEPSDRPVALGGQSVPAAYASVLYIDSLPFGGLLRSLHHWSAYVMVAAAFFHLLRVALTGSYKRPREVNWMVGLALLGLTVVTAFTGYALPNDNYAVTATKIGYGIAGAVPWVGGWLAQVVFGGEYPTSHSLPRLHFLHVFLLPLALFALVGLHLLIMVKQKHSQPPYARRVAPGKVLGIPLWPNQALIMGVLFLLYLGLTGFVAGAFDAHPVTVFGPPTPATPSVKPDFYFLWIYGFLQMIPSSWQFSLLGATFGPEFWGGVVLPSLLALAALLLPLIDRAESDQPYAEQPSRHPRRTGAVMASLALLLILTLAGYHQELGLPLALMWVLLLAGPPLVYLLSAWAVRRGWGAARGGSRIPQAGPHD